MNISLVTSIREFDGLSDRWRELVRQSESSSIFQSWDWQFLWWQTYGNGQQLYILKVEDPLGRLVGLLPLYVSRCRMFPGLQARFLRPIGTGGDTSPDYLGPVLATGVEQEVGRALLGYLRDHRQDWDALSLSDMLESLPFLREVKAWSVSAPWTCEVSPSARISFVSLPSSWDSYLAELSGERRYSIRNTRRKFLAVDGARFFTVNDPALIDSAFDRLSELHHARWNSLGEVHSFSTDLYNNFHRSVMRRCMEAGCLRIYCMAIGEVTIAMYYCYAWDGITYYFQGGFDPAYEKLRPGLCLMGYAIECSIEEKQHTFDMLRGEYEYKKQWAKELRTTYEYCFYSRTLRGRMYRIQTVTVPRLKQIAKSLLRRS